MSNRKLREIYLKEEHCLFFGVDYSKTGDFVASVADIRNLRISWDERHKDFFNLLSDKFGEKARVTWRRISYEDTKHYGFVAPQSPGWFFLWKVEGLRFNIFEKS